MNKFTRHLIPLCMLLALMVPGVVSADVFTAEEQQEFNQHTLEEVSTRFEGQRYEPEGGALSAVTDPEEGGGTSQDPESDEDISIDPGSGGDGTGDAGSEDGEGGLEGGEQSASGGGTNPSGSGPTLKNPFGSNVQNIPDLLKTIINDIILPIGSIIVVFMVIYSGFLFVKARGKDEELSKAKKTFTWTIVGGLVLLGAWAISQAIIGTICTITGGVPGLGC